MAFPCFTGLPEHKDARQQCDTPGDCACPGGQGCKQYYKENEAERLKTLKELREADHAIRDANHALNEAEEFYQLDEGDNYPSNSGLEEESL